MTSMLLSLQTLIHASSLPKQSQKEFLEILSGVPEKILKHIVALCSESPEWVEKLHHNYQTKKQTLAKLDKKAWKKIIDEEEKEIKQVA